MEDAARIFKNTFDLNIIPENEEARIKKVRSFDIPGSEGVLTSVTELARDIFDVPIALVAIVESNKVIFKANSGMDEIMEVSRGISLCSLAILSDDVTIFRNALEEKCLGRNPLVTGNFRLRFYAGAPLKTTDGFNIGTLCLVDTKPRDFSANDALRLEELAQNAINLIESHYKI